MRGAGPGGIHLKLRKSSFLTKLIILALIAYATITLISLSGQITEVKASSAELREQITAATEQNLQLSDQIANINTIAGVEEAARTKLGLMGDGEIVFYDIGG